MKIVEIKLLKATAYGSLPLWKATNDQGESVTFHANDEGTGNLQVIAAGLFRLKHKQEEAGVI